MSQLTDIILSQVKSSAKGSDLSGDILSGLSDSILGSVKQSAQSATGLEQLTSLLTGKTSATSSPVTALAEKLFKSDFVKKLGLDASTASAATKLIPVVISALVSKKNNGFDLSSITSMLGLGGGSSSSSSTGSLLKTAGSLLSGFLKKK